MVEAIVPRTQFAPRKRLKRHRNREGKQAGGNGHGDEAMQYSRVASVQHNAVIRHRNHEHAEADKQQTERGELNLLRVRRHFFETGFEKSAKREADQNLNSEYEDSGFVQRIFDFVFELGHGRRYKLVTKGGRIRSFHRRVVPGRL